jgi:ribonuclease E
VQTDVAAYLNNKKRREVSALEDEGKMSIQILGTDTMYPEHLELECTDADGREVKLNY